MFTAIIALSLWLVPGSPAEDATPAIGVRQNPLAHELNLPEGWNYEKTGGLVTRLSGPEGEAIFYPSYGFDGDMARARHLVDPQAVSFFTYCRQTPVRVVWDSSELLSLSCTGDANYWAFPKNSRQCALYLGVMLTRLNNDQLLKPSPRVSRLTVSLGNRRIQDLQEGRRLFDGNRICDLDVTQSDEPPEPNAKWKLERPLCGGKLVVQQTGPRKVTAYFFKPDGAFVSYCANAGDRPSVILAILAAVSHPDVAKQPLG